MYAYTDDDPTTLTDPSGACPECVGAAIGGIVGGVSYSLSQPHDFSWSGFGTAACKGVLYGFGAGLLMPAAGAGAVDLLGLEEGGTAATVNAGVGAAYTWAFDSALCEPTTPGDLLLGALGGAFSGLRPGESPTSLSAVEDGGTPPGTWWPDHVTVGPGEIRTGDVFGDVVVRGGTLVGHVRGGTTVITGGGTVIGNVHNVIPLGHHNVIGELGPEGANSLIGDISGFVVQGRRILGEINIHGRRMGPFDRAQSPEPGSARSTEGRVPARAKTCRAPSPPSRTAYPLIAT